ncbi:MAG: GDP-mannose 4,6-dehydratase [Candidatus Cloacimonetes bacterium]|nr:GDP-mannose 4,6-dehydratase [Candidatus Cloacimonadota bacterium]MCF7814966.1 GDP-mannose 4,6-dehydratase [Candidatus Cloacimonadota bacterium]MCF7868427.1 GDP-mannose 4,6-dehydratase [Candidatus Cloacimonadota bacterium]MCF7883900.1 GDP-mannose 4,6-dehydratase [Candidatus Cloacimonadota bacterium]
MKILITGGAGFIGSHLAEKLLKEGHEISVIDNLSTGKYSNIIHLIKNEKFNYVIDSILNRDVLEKLIKNADQIYHLAAAVGVKYIIDNPLLSLRTNIVGAENVLEFANKYKKKVLIASTSEIYGKSDKIPFKEEDDRLLGSTHISRWSYSSAKAIDEFLALAYHREKKLPVVIVRCFNTVGPRQTGQYGMVVPKFVHNALLNHPITIFGDGKQSRCFCDVCDVTDGMIKLMNTKKAEGQIFNIGNDKSISIEELAQKVKKMTNSRSKIDYVKYEDAYEEGFEDMRHRKPDLTKVQEMIGYKPKFSLDQILQRIINFFEE